MSVSVYSEGYSTEEDMNVSNINFRKLMDLLDVDYDYDSECLCGRISGPSLLALKQRTAVLLETVRVIPELDGGIIDRDLLTGGQRTVENRFINFGWPPGYIESRLSHLLAIIEEAIELNVSLVYV